MRPDLRPSVLASATWAIGLRGVALLLTFAFSVVLGRLAGPAGAGDFYLVVTFVHVLGVLGRVGLDNTVLRFVAEEEERGRAAAEGVLRQGLRVAALPVLGLSAALWLAAPWLARVFDEPGLAHLLGVGALAVLPYALCMLLGEALKGAHRPVSAQAVQFVAIQAALLVAFLLLPERDSRDAVRAYAIAAWCAALLGLGVWYGRGVGTLGMADRFPLRRLLRSSVPLLFVTSMMLIHAWTDTVLLALFGDQEDVGRYGVAFRLAGLLTVAQFVVNGIVAPRIVTLYRASDLDGCSRLARRAALGLGALTLPPLLVLVALPGRCLDVFGEGFGPAAPALVVLALAYWVKVLCGGVVQILAVIGRERLLLAVNVAMAALNVVLNLLLIPRYGTLGAALGTGTTVVLSNVLLVVWMRRRIGIRILV